MYKKYQCEECGKEVLRNNDRPIHFCNLTCKSNYQRRAKPVSKEWLEQKYIAEKLDCTKIGKLVKRDPKSVWNWLKDFEIPTRPRGEVQNWKWIREGRKSPWTGRKHSEETKEKLRQCRIKDGHIPGWKNGKHWTQRLDKSRHPRWKGGISPQRQKMYSSDEWKKASKKVWKRDKGICQKFGKNKNNDRSEPFDIHHIVSFENEELRCKVSNLILLCEKCHYWVHSKNNTNKIFIKEKSND